MLRLWVESQHGAEARIPVRWCLDKATVDALKEQGVVPYLFLVVAAGGKEYERKLVPLDQMMEYVTFRKPGLNTVNAAVIYTYNIEETFLLLKKTEFKEYRVSFNPSDEGVVSFTTDIRRGTDGIVSIAIQEEAYVQIEVAKEFFAPDPPRWLLAWATGLWDTPLTDQCDFRRRVIFSFTVQPFIVAILLVCAVCTVCAVEIAAFACALFMLSLGMRGIRWRYVFWPWEKTCGEIVLYLSGIWDWHFRPRNSIFFTDRNGEESELRTVFIPFMPLAMTLFFGLSSLVLISANKWSLSKAITEAVFFSTLLFSLFFVEYVLEMIKKHYSSKPRKEKEKKPSAPAIVKPELDWETIVCDGAPTSYSVHSLPKQKRSFHLRMEEFKQHVCRPFAS